MKRAKVELIKSEPELPPVATVTVNEEQLELLTMITGRCVHSRGLYDPLLEAYTKITGIKYPHHFLAVRDNNTNKMVGALRIEPL